MKIITPAQTRALDAHTIAHEPIASLDLMERASLTFVRWFQEQFPSTDTPVLIFCGIGNNGGDGLAIARLLSESHYAVQVFCCQISPNTSPDFQANLLRLPTRQGIQKIDLPLDAPLPTIPTGSILIDAIFGAGLNRPVSGYWAELLTHLNTQKSTRIAIDIPSGLFAHQATTTTTFQADFTFSFELPKLAFFLPENAKAVGHWVVHSIGLSPSYIDQLKTPYHFIQATDIEAIYRKRARFSHKGTYGHVLHLMGSKSKVGAALLAGQACLRSGAGLLTIHAPEVAYPILQIGLPEAMVSTDPEADTLSTLLDLSAYKAIGCGCGIGLATSTIIMLHELLESAQQPLVLDADALNIIAKQHWQERIPRGSILSPHPKEFERLFGKTNNQFERLERLRERAQALQCTIILKGAYTCIATPSGECFFNSTGNPGMATAGSGDVLTGILTGLLSQGYSPVKTAILGVYLHGLAGDLAAAKMSPEALLAGDITRHLGAAYRLITA